MIRLLDFLSYLVGLYEWIVIASVIISWLGQMEMINRHNPTVRAIKQALDSVTEPLLRPIRRMLPATGGLDFSPIVLLLICLFIRWVIIGNLRELV